MWPNLTPPPVLLVLLLAMVIGGAIGAFNGFFVAKYKLHPFIVTLATQLIIYTFLLLYVKAGENNGMAEDRRHAHSQLRVDCRDLHRPHVVHLEQDHLRQEHVRPGRQ